MLRHHNGADFLLASSVSATEWQAVDLTTRRRFTASSRTFRHPAPCSLPDDTLTCLDLR
jgi:hypothetical protein